MKRLTRRKLFQFGLAVGGSLLLPLSYQYRTYAKDAGSPKVIPFSLPFKIPPVLRPVRSDSTTDYYEITMRRASVDILPGRKTEIWSYNGMSPGPTIRQRKVWYPETQQFRRSVVRFINSVGVPTTVHLHGMASLPQYDGYAEDMSAPGFYKDYIYPNNRAATLWYHDHALHNTARNVYMGLAGMYIVEDDEELNLPLPKGQYDVPLMLADKIFARDGRQVFDDQGEKHVMGDVITINGVPWPRMEVANRKYRFRLLNASISRSYLLKLSTADDFIFIGTDAGLMSQPARVKEFRIGPAERYEFILDFSRYPIGTQVILQNGKLPNNDEFDNTDKVMLFEVTRSETDNSSIPNVLRNNIPPVSEMMSQAVRTRDFRYERSNGLWVINGKTWDKNRVDANPAPGDVEIWRIYNNAGGWHHPIHVHLVDAQIIDRNSQQPFAYERGWKDVFYVGENESVQIVGKFSSTTGGKYMSHCHNTVHEDHDMMNQFEVGIGGPSPFSDPPKPLPAPPL
ncbi:multicopper oxidase family protein [Dulcicalothrix desertica]|uniref:multicopper oxidase family protein n=1 Tax=Dulcicalothrix desertica TaxID=32056 RepID=UPI000F8E6FBE|nr:multicopper oxidase family protein [Dulcicalothrix desertica]TWH39136.1 FtsP/CotA-like multicopper oxidase with cupredoxin domain [Dulcicalothrix desertica PCC 7102]